MEGGGLVLHRGVALISGGFELCSQDVCDYPTFEQTFRITR
ncbi:hypothetical protein PSN13_04219 [Micromonospora saelicesensis]|uniref:Uncharacterized protein n=1 Tax=Micromonospora saelicesensis TaxID=285676 RepID=A0A328NMA0_9ACTN|nr:hypothetical protein [Micromonospora saelicesensis]RAO31321.1 hypothetical protein PSN13_04219 [Micromonospora saelicesensis]